MASEQEPAKALLPYLQRADELQKHEPIVAYYCRLYAMDRGLKIPASDRTKTTNSLLNSLIKQLEKDKKSLNLGPEDNLYLEGFSLNLFGKADKQDRAGRADLNTAKTFYAASIFFETLNQFGPLQPDLEQKQKYAAWKAVDIRKALKEGRKPTPGPPAGDEDLSVPSSSPSDSNYLHTSDTTSFHQEPEDSSSQIQKIDRQHSADVSPSPSSLASSNYPPHDFQPPTYSVAKPVSSSYPTSYSHEPYPSEAQHLPQDFPSDAQQHHLHGYPPEYLPQMPHSFPLEQQHIPPGHLSDLQPHQSNDFSSQNSTMYSYPHFQSYPSFADASVPSVPSQHPSYYQGPDSSYPSHSGHPGRSSLSGAQYDTGSINGVTTEASPRAQTYHYDSNYQPPPEKIAEAHKAARFAVGALAFDDVSVAVDFLKKSLELLTKPSAGQ